MIEIKCRRCKQGFGVGNSHIGQGGTAARAFQCPDCGETYAPGDPVIVKQVTYNGSGVSLRGGSINIGGDVIGGDKIVRR